MYTYFNLNQRCPELKPVTLGDNNRRGKFCKMSRFGN